MYRIEVNGQTIEAPNATVTLNFQRSKIGEVTIAGDGSQTIQIPKTIKNIAAFGYCNFVESESVYPYAIGAARVYQDEVLLIDNAEFTILRTVPDAFECAITWGNSPMLNALKSLYMCEIPLGIYRKFPLGGLEQPIDVKIYGEAFFFQTQDNEGVITDHYTTFKDGGGMWRDAITGKKELYSVLEQILSRIGISHSFADATAESNFNESYVIDTAKSATIPKFKLHAIVADRTIDIGRWGNDGDHVTEYKRLDADDKEAYHVDEPYVGQVDDPSYYHELRDYYIPQDGYYDLTLKISYSQDQVGEPDGHGGYIQQSSSVNVVFAGGQMALYDNGVGFERAVRSTEQDLSDTLDIRGDQTRMWIDADEVTDLVVTRPKQFYKKGRHGLWLIGEGGLQTTYEHARFLVNAELTVTPYNGVEVDVVDEQECYLDHNFTYRDATAYEVLTQTIKAFGLMAQLDVNTSTLNLYTYNTIAANAIAGDVTDWSDRLVGREDSVEYDLSLPQFLAMKWKPEAQYNGGRDAEFEILSKTAGSVDYLTNSVYSACNGMHIRPMEVIGIPLINYMSRKTETPEIRELVGYMSGAKLVKITGALPSDPPISVYIAEGKYIVTAGGNFVSADDSYFDYANTIDGIGVNFKSLLDALYRIVYIKVPMRLTPIDVATLDFTKPIYLEQYNAYFALEKVQYGDNGVSKVELIKLNLQ